MNASALTSDPQIRRAVADCRDITRNRAGNFYWGLRLTPEPQRSAMYAIYAWMREADDIADDANTDSAQRTARVWAFRAATDEALAGRCAHDSSVWRALAAVAREYTLDAHDFHAMLDGQIADLVPRRLQDWIELRTYCTQVASTVGCVCVRIWGYDHPAAIALAVDRGIAFQLTNILRDIVEDIARDRVYLPASEFARVGVTPEELCRWSNPAACADLLGQTIALAREHFVRSAPLDGMITPACRPTLRAMTEIYRQLLEQIARDPSRVVRERVALSTLRKVLIGLRAKTLGGGA
ncbi:MAG: phytoene/squalene synthase family protein [Phycisphaerales bacterium]|nr:phytoene/squalene synthase family protein [Phycisphaerales bacterium]